MSAKFVIEDGDLKEAVFSLEEGESWIIGSDPSESAFVLEDPEVPARQAIIQKNTDGKFTIQNISAVDPLFVNDEEIGSHLTVLQQGDTVRIGKHELHFFEEENARIVEPQTNESLIESFLKEEPEETPPSNPEPQENLIETLLPNYQEIKESFDSETSDPTIFAESEEEIGHLAEINFSLIEGGRWLLKVVGGPNNGAEFYMQTGQSYVIGTDPHVCDIVFHDNSVSRQHAKITVSSDDELSIEDLKSRNGIFVEGVPVEGSKAIETNKLITTGTTSFLIYDREGEMQTIISPLLPSIVRSLQKDIPEDGSKEGSSETNGSSQESEAIKAALEKPKHHYGSLIIASIIVGLFVLATIGTIELFKAKPVTLSIQENAEELIQSALKPYPAVRETFNKASGNLLLLGHVATAADRSQLLYKLQGLKFVKSVDDSGLVIDEYVWQEMNSILAKNPNWRGITIHSPSAGNFILGGYLKTRKEAEALSNYVSINFPYIDLLKKDIIVEEDVLSQVSSWLRESGFVNVTPKMTNGEIVLSGDIPSDKVSEINQLIEKVKTIPGVRSVNSYIQPKTAELGAVDLSDQYSITGQSRVGSKYTVVINGKILSEGDVLDGMEIKTIAPNTILLEKGDTKYRIGY